jgi:peptidoglycan hydrolase CwlO-like protein
VPKKRIDLIGKHFGRWTVIAKRQSKWLAASAHWRACSASPIKRSCDGRRCRLTAPLTELREAQMSKVDELQKLIAALQKEIEDIDFQIDELEEQKDPLEEEIAELEDKIEALEDEELEAELANT